LSMQQTNHTLKIKRINKKKIYKYYWHQNLKQYDCT
jgi:hypothetical protein